MSSSQSKYLNSIIRMAFCDSNPFHIGIFWHCFSIICCLNRINNITPVQMCVQIQVLFVQHFALIFYLIFYWDAYTSNSTKTILQTAKKNVCILSESMNLKRFVRLSLHYIHQICLFRCFFCYRFFPIWNAIMLLLCQRFDRLIVVFAFI